MPVLVLVLVGALAALLGAYKAARPLRRRSLIKQTARTPISELRSGFHMARGRVRGGRESFAGPISGKDCVYYRFSVEEHKKRGKNSQWVTVVSRTRSGAFDIEDESGVAAVNPKDAEVLLELDHHYSSGMLSSLPESVARTLEREFGTKTKGWVFNKKLRVKETVLERGDEIHVVGQVAFGRDGPSFEGAGELFVVSDKGAAAILQRETWSALGWIGFAALVVGVCAVTAAVMLPEASL